MATTVDDTMNDDTVNWKHNGSLGNQCQQTTRRVGGPQVTRDELVLNT